MKNLVVILLLIISSRASMFARSEFILILTFLVSLPIINLKEVVKKQKVFVITFAFMMFHFALFFIKLGSLSELLPLIKYYFAVFLTMLVMVSMQERFLLKTEKIVFFTIFYTVPIWMIQQFSGQAIISVLSNIADLIPVISYKLPNHINVIFYTVKTYTIERNSGFYWEPGGYACVLGVSYLIYYFTNSYRNFKKDTIYIIGLATTLSTLGYIIILIILILNTYRVKSSYRVLFLPIVVVSFIYVLQLPFMYDKVMDRYSSSVSNASDLQNDRKNKSVVSTGRFGSLLLDFQSLKESPLLGRGINNKKFSDEFLDGGKINMANGLSNYIATFGLLGLVILMLGLFRTSNALFHYRYRNKLWYLFPFSILLFTFSNPVLFTPLFIYLYFFGYMYNSEYKLKHSANGH